MIVSDESEAILVAGRQKSLRSRCNGSELATSCNHDSNNDKQCTVVMKMRMGNCLRAVCLVLAIVADDRLR